MQLYIQISTIQLLMLYKVYTISEWDFIAVLKCRYSKLTFPFQINFFFINGHLRKAFFHYKRSGSDPPNTDDQNSGKSDDDMTY